MPVCNWLEVLDTLEDQIQLCDTFKRKTLEAAKAVSVETLWNFEGSGDDKIARNRDQ